MAQECLKGNLVLQFFIELLILLLTLLPRVRSKLRSKLRECKWVLGADSMGELELS